MKAQKIIVSFRAGMAFVISCLFTGCLTDSREDCDWDVCVNISVRAQTEEGIFATAERADIFLFDHNGFYTHRLSLSKEQLENGDAITVPLGYGKMPWAVVWGNAGDIVELGAPQPGMTMEQAVLTLVRDSEGYSVPASDLFYGSERLSGEYCQTITIAPKTARVAVAVKGLGRDADASRHFFSVGTFYDGYDFRGSPLQNTAEIKLPAVYGEGGSLVTPGSFNVIHYPDDTVRKGASERGAVINMYRKDKESDSLLISVSSDEYGRPLVPQAGKTLNVLINFTASGEVEITVRITEWEEIYEWKEW